MTVSQYNFIYKTQATARIKATGRSLPISALDPELSVRLLTVFIINRCQNFEFK